MTPTVASTLAPVTFQSDDLGRYPGYYLLKSPGWMSVKNLDYCSLYVCHDPKKALAVDRRMFK